MRASFTGAAAIGQFPIVELRQYTLHGGQRDTLIDLFEREFIESQEVLGMKVIGTFRDLDRPNRFVWLRGFTDMNSRMSGLTDFYGGPVWKAHREEANATMVDSDNVLLLHAPNAAAAFRPAPTRPVLGEKRGAGLIVGTIYYLKAAPDAARGVFSTKVKRQLEKAGVPVLAWFVPEKAANNYPRLPVREGERVLVWFARYDSEADRAGHAKAVTSAESALAPLLARSPEVLRLQPTDRSELR
jgi:hypothetical protein